MNPYAILTDLTAWLPASTAAALDPADAPRLLQRASEAVADAVTAGYAVDSSGNPSDPVIAAALRDATCAQVEQWLEVSEENDIAGYPSNTLLSGGGLSQNRLPPTLAPRARRILRSEGLTASRAY